MPRPKKERQVLFEPPARMFAPIDREPAGEVVLTVEELEALRLVDFEGLYQEEAARLMSVSRPTLTRMLAMARGKVAEALSNALAIRIYGGTFRITEPPPCAPFCGGKGGGGLGGGRRRRRRGKW